MNILTKQSFLPCRWPFNLLLSCHNPLSYPSAPVQALWRLSLKKNDEEMLLLVPSKFFDSGGKVLWYSKTCCHFYRCTRNILTSETTTGNRSVTPRRVWVVQHLFINTNFQTPAPGSEFGRLFYSTNKIFHR